MIYLTDEEIKKSNYWLHSNEILKARAIANAASEKAAWEIVDLIEEISKGYNLIDKHAVYRLWKDLVNKLESQGIKKPMTE